MSFQKLPIELQKIVSEFTPTPVELAEEAIKKILKTWANLRDLTAEIIGFNKRHLKRVTACKLCSGYQDLPAFYLEFPHTYFNEQRRRAFHR